MRFGECASARVDEAKGPVTNRTFLGCLVARVGTLLLSASSIGCSLLFVDGPPPEYAKLPSVDCTAGRGWPVVDTLLGGVFALDAALAATGGFGEDSEGKKLDSGAKVALTSTFIGLAALGGYSAYYGFANVAECREAGRVVARNAPAPATSAESFTYILRTLDEVPNEATYERLRATARQLGWRIEPVPAWAGYRLHFSVDGGGSVRIGDAYMNDEKTNAVVVGCSPPSAERCSSVVDSLFGAPSAGQGTADDSRARTNEPEPRPLLPESSPKPAAALAPQVGLPMTVTTPHERITLLALTRGREWKGLPDPTKLELPANDELLVVRYATEALPGAPSMKDRLALTTREGSKLSPTSDIVVSVSQTGTTWVERAFVLPSSARPTALTINGGPFALEAPTTAPMVAVARPDCKRNVCIEVEARVLEELRALGDDVVLYTSKRRPLRALGEIRRTGEEVGLFGFELLSGVQSVLRAADVGIGGEGSGIARVLGDAYFPQLFTKNAALRLFVTHAYDDHRERAIVERGGGIRLYLLPREAAGP